MRTKEENGYMTCEAHDLLIKDVERLKNDVGDLYSQDRTAQADVAEIKQDIAEIKTDNKYIKTDLAEVKEKQAVMEQSINKINTAVNSINDTVKNINSSKWTSKDYVAIITALLALAGVIVTALCK